MTKVKTLFTKKVSHLLFITSFSRMIKISKKQIYIVQQKSSNFPVTAFLFGKNVGSSQYILPKRNQYTRYSNQAPWKSERFGYLALKASRASAAAALSANELTITRYIALSALNAIVA